MVEEYERIYKITYIPTGESYYTATKDGILLERTKANVNDYKFEFIESIRYLFDKKVSESTLQSRLNYYKLLNAKENGNAETKKESPFAKFRNKQAKKEKPNSIITIEEEKPKEKKKKKKNGTKSGFFRVTRKNKPQSIIGYIWVQEYPKHKDSDLDERILPTDSVIYGFKVTDTKSALSNANLFKLKRRVLANGLDWIISNQENAEKSIALNKENFPEDDYDAEKNES